MVAAAIVVVSFVVLALVLAMKYPDEMKKLLDRFKKIRTAVYTVVVVLVIFFFISTGMTIAIVMAGLISGVLVLTVWFEFGAREWFMEVRR